MPSSRIHKAMGVVTSDLTEFETYTPSLNMAIRFHRKPMAKGKVVFQDTGSGTFQSWPAGSLNEILHKVVCQ